MDFDEYIKQAEDALKEAPNQADLNLADLHDFIKLHMMGVNQMFLGLAQALRIEFKRLK